MSLLVREIHASSYRSLKSIRFSDLDGSPSSSAPTVSARPTSIAYCNCCKRRRADDVARACRRRRHAIGHVGGPPAGGTASTHRSFGELSARRERTSAIPTKSMPASSIRPGTTPAGLSRACLICGSRGKASGHARDKPAGVVPGRMDDAGIDLVGMADVRSRLAEARRKNDACWLSRPPAAAHMADCMPPSPASSRDIVPPAAACSSCSTR